MFFPLLLSCTSETTKTSAPPSARVEYILDQEWSSRPWEMQTDPIGKEIRMEATIELADSDPIEGAGIRFAGLWWEGNLQINGKAVPTFYGGNQEAEIPVGDYLTHGENHISLTLKAPFNISSKVTGGTPSSIIKEKNTADLFFPPRLILRAQNHISGIAIPLKEGSIHPVVWTEGEESAQVALQVELDGKILQDLGTCPINQGVSNCSPQEWKLDKWDIGDPHLYQIRGILKDKQGNILDQMVEKTGARELGWSSEGIWINQKKKQLLSARMVHRRGGEDFSSRLQLYQKAGVNTLEFHGELLRKDWLSIMDELGVGAAIVPRCIGRCNHRNGGSSKEQHAFMTLQDQRLLWDIKSHPSMTLFALEGASTKRSQDSIWTEYLQNNIHNIPVFGQDLPVRLLKMELKEGKISSQCFPKGCKGAWLVETVLQSQFPPWDLLSQEYLKIQEEGAIGGVIPTPRKKIDLKEKYEWMEAWQGVHTTLAPTPLTTDTKRASSQITVQSKANQLVTIRAVGINTLRKKTDQKGIASFTIFYQGALEIQCGEQIIQEKVSADHWEQLQRVSKNPYFYCEI